MVESNNCYAIILTETWFKPPILDSEINIDVLIYLDKTDKAKTMVELLSILERAYLLLTALANQFGHVKHIVLNVKNSKLFSMSFRGPPRPTLPSLNH